MWLALGTACTIQPSADPSREAIDVIATEPELYELGVARDTRVSFWFSAPLDPASLAADAIELTSNEVRQGGRVRYDPIERRLTFTPRGLFRRDLAYDATLAASLRGLRRGEPVAATTLTFVTGLDEAGRPAPAIASFEGDVLPVFQRSCASSSCHGPPSNRSGLDLSDAAAASSSLLRVRSFGWVGWDRVDPGSAAWSYLVYKLIGEESVRGEAMPPGSPLPLDEIEAVASWIDGGAKVDAATDGP
jgi:hypothetical protein